MTDAPDTAELNPTVVVNTSTPAGERPERGGIRRESTGFEARLRGYLQGRLRVVALFFSVVSGILLIPSHGLSMMVGEWSPRMLYHPVNIIHVGSAALAFAIWLGLRSRPLAMRTLLGIDVLLVGVTLVTTLGIYALAYDDSLPAFPGLIALFLVLRALIVPSTVRRTLLVSIPAPIGLLIIQVSYGHMYAWPNTHMPHDFFIAHAVWYQATLWIAVGMAAIASWINFSLRVEAWKAKEMDQYLIEGRLGEGGMGEVFRARHALMRRPTAIKLIRPELAGVRNLQRFEREVRNTSRLTHPNTIRIFDYGRTPDGIFFYAMELIEGADLERIVERTGPMPAARVIHVLHQACGALHEAHVKGLIHRDVKPSNLLLATQGLNRDVVKVMDFGLVKDTTADATLTQADEICGSPHTIPPEALTGRQITAQSDIYSLGAVGCYLLTGKPIFDARTVIEFATAHLHQEPIAPSSQADGVPADLETVLLACLAKDPEDRPRDATALAAQLAACADSEGWTGEHADAWWAEHESRLIALPVPDAVT